MRKHVNIAYERRCRVAEPYTLGGTRDQCCFMGLQGARLVVVTHAFKRLNVSTIMTTKLRAVDEKHHCCP